MYIIDNGGGEKCIEYLREREGEGEGETTWEIQAR
jgi:hypothetical protein